MALALGWAGWILYVTHRRPQEKTWVHQVVSNCAVVLLGLVARGIIFSS